MSVYEDKLAGIRQNWIDFATFRINMFFMNRLLMPTMNGPQYGNDYAQRIVHKKVLDILDERIKEMEEFWKNDN